MIENIKAKDATPEQIALIRQNLAQKRENRKIEIEINEAIQLASRKGKQNPHPTKAPVKKRKSLGLKLAKAIKIIFVSLVGVMHMLWIFIRNLSVNDWLLMAFIAIVIYLWKSII